MKRLLVLLIAIMLIAASCKQPVADFTWSPLEPDTGEEVQFTNLSQDAKSYSWNFGVSKNFLHTTEHGAIEGKTQTKEVKYYNLDMIISLGYRINSKTATKFRQWATVRLKEYIVNVS
jgi:hypothetical protein